MKRYLNFIMDAIIPFISCNAIASISGLPTTLPGWNSQLPGKKDAFIFMTDKWNPRHLKDSRYLWLPVQFSNGIPFVEWKDEWNLGFFDKM